MACACKGKKGQRWKVTLKGGLSVEKTTEAAAVAFSAKHPGSVVTRV
jgi:hypothetical protein